jgi:N6-L-threonylcarbamoyladenine synthase
MTIILGIETSCDETAAAILKIEEKVEILSNIVASQINLHKKFGGIVPEVAARAHIEKIIPVIDQAFEEAKINPKNLDLIGVTIGPGLITSLLIGVETAKTLSFLLNKPLVPINHLIGHIYASFINLPISEINEKIFPALCLVVSGGHTELILMDKEHKFKKIGQTLDDACGECFDKIAKFLNIGYPGGPIIAKLAKEYDPKNSKFKFEFPRPLINAKNYNFSFSGLKTAVLYKIKDLKFQLVGSKKEITKKLKKSPQWVRKEKKQCLRAICAEVQQAIIDVLISKSLKAISEFEVKTFILSGGVAANEALRNQMELKISKLPKKINFLVPEKKFCTDNAAMIALATYFKWQKMDETQKELAKENWKKIQANVELELV